MAVRCLPMAQGARLLDSDSSSAIVQREPEVAVPVRIDIYQEHELLGTVANV